MERNNHKRYQYGHNIKNDFSVSKMAVLLNLCHFNAEVTLDHTIFYYLKKKYDETLLTMYGSFSLKFSLGDA